MLATLRYYYYYNHIGVVRRSLDSQIAAGLSLQTDTSAVAHIRCQLPNVSFPWLCTVYRWAHRFFVNRQSLQVPVLYAERSNALRE